MADRVASPKRGAWALALRGAGMGAVLAILLGALALGPATALLSKGWSLKRHGLAVQGEITALTLEPRNQLRQDYAFRAEGALWTGHESVSPSQGRRSGPVVVHYLPGDPAWNALTPGLPFFQGSLASFLAFAIGFSGLAALGSRLEAARATLRLRDTGACLSAIVTRVESRALFRRLHWLDASGQAGASQWRLGRHPLPDSGATITLYADPGHRRPPVWEDDVGCRQTLHG